MLKTRFQRDIFNVIEARDFESVATSRCLLVSVSQRVGQGRRCKKNEIIRLTAATCGKIEYSGYVIDLIHLISVDSQAIAANRGESLGFAACYNVG